MEATLELDRAPFTRSLSIARAMADAFERGEFMATLGAKLGELRDDLRSGTRDLTEFARQRATATVRADDRPARRTLTGFDEVMRRYSRSWGQQGIRARVQADVRRAQGQLRLLERQLEGITDERHRLIVEAEITRTRERLEGLGRLATSLGLQSPTISVGLRGQAATYAQMLGLQRLADRLDGYNIRFGADIDGSLSRALPNLLGALEMQIAKYKTVMTGIAAITMPMFYSSLAALPAVLTAATGAAGSLAISLGKGLVGAAGAGTVALGLGGAALFAYGKALGSTRDYAFRLNDIISQQSGDLSSAKTAVEAAKVELKKYEKGTKEHTLATRGLAVATQNEKQEQEELNALLQSATPRVMRLADAGHGLTLEMIELKGAIANEVAPSMESWIRGATRLLPTLRPHVLDMVSDITEVADSYVDAAQKGRNLRSITTIMKGIKSAGVPSLRIVGDVALIAVNVLSKMVPAGLDVLDVTRKLTGAARKWSGSAKGQRRIGEVWADLWRRGRQLWSIGVDLGAALWGVGRALDAAGTGDKLLRQLGGLVKGFRATMRTGGAGREAITDFMNTAEPLLDAGISLASEFGKQFVRLAKAVIGFKEEGSKLTVLEDIFYAIEDSLKPMADFFLYEFKNIGPLIGPFIRELADWFSTMAKSQPEMKFFIGFLTDMLHLFNSLDENDQRTIARVLAYVYAIKALGGGTAISGLGTLAGTVTQWLLLRRIWNNMPKAPVIAPPVSGPAASPKPGPFRPGGRGSPIPAPVVPAPVPAKGFFSNWMTRLKSFPWLKGGAWIGAAVGAALALDYFVMPSMHKLGMRLQTWVENTFGFQFPRWVDNASKNASISLPINMWRGLKAGFANYSWSKFGQDVMDAVKRGLADVPLGGAIGGVLGGLFSKARRLNAGKDWPGIGSFAVMAIGKGWQRGGLLGIASGIISRWFARSSGTSKSKNWGGIGGGAVGGIVKGFARGGLVGAAAALVGNWFGKTQGSSKGKRWGGIGSGAIGAMAKGFRSGGLVGAAVALVGSWFGKTSGSSKAKRWNGIGGSAIGAMARGFRSGGLVGAAVALVGNWFGNTQGSSKGKRWGGIGSGAISAMAKGFKSGGLIGAAVALVGSWFGKTSGSSKGKRWGGIGSSAIGAIVKGWKSGGLIGAAVSLVAAWFGRSQGEKNRKRWSPLGSSAAGEIVKGWKNGGLIGAAVALVGAWFGKTTGSSKGKRWSPIGQGAAGAIAKGWRDGGLLGAATALVNSWFGRSQGSSKGKPWNGIGGGAVGGIVSGWRNGGLLGAGTALVGSWFGKTDSTSRSKNWRGIGGGAIGAMVSGWKSGGLVGAVVSVVGQAASGANNKQGSFRTAGGNAGVGFLNGWNAVNVATAFINKISGGLAALARWLRQRSPSQRLADFAWNTAQGFVQGLDSNKNVEPAFRGMGERGLKAVQSRPPSKPMRLLGRLAGEGMAGGAGESLEQIRRSGEEMGRTLVNAVRMSISALNLLRRELVETGRYMSEGLVRGVLEGSRKVQMAMVSIARNAILAARATLRIASPSGEGWDIGRNLGKSLGLGLDSTRNAVRDAAKSLAEAAIAGARKAINKPLPMGLGFSPNLRPALTPIRSTMPVPRGPIRRPSPVGSRPAPRPPGAPGRTPPPVNVSVTVPVSRDMDVAEERAVAAAQQQIRAAFAEIKRQGSSNSAYIAGEVS